MAIHWNSVSDKVRMAYDDSTGERGMQVLMTANGTIAKGNTICVQQGGTSDRVVIVPTTGNENDMPIGVAYTTATAGTTFWMWTSGSCCEVLPEPAVTATLGYVLTCSTGTAGTAAQSASAPVAATHFKEVGHWLKTGTGNGALTLASIHFN